LAYAGEKQVEIGRTAIKPKSWQMKWLRGEMNAEEAKRFVEDLMKQANQPSD